MFIDIVKSMAFVYVKKLKIYYHKAGEGETILFLHGWGGSSKSFFNLQELLSKRYNTISLDLPGFGKSDIPHSAWRVEDYVNFTLAFLRKFEIKKCWLIGHSFGGRVAIVLAAKHPEKFSGLVLISAAGIKHGRSTRGEILRLLASWGNYATSLPFLRTLKEHTRYVFYKIIRRQDYYLAKGVMKDTMKQVIEEDLTPYLSRIKTKTLIIWGDKDTITPIHDAFVMKRKINDATLEIIKNGSHYLPRKYYKELFDHIKRFILQS